MSQIFEVWKLESKKNGQINGWLWASSLVFNTTMQQLIFQSLHQLLRFYLKEFLTKLSNKMFKMGRKSKNRQIKECIRAYIPILNPTTQQPIGHPYIKFQVYSLNSSEKIVTQIFIMFESWRAWKNERKINGWLSASVLILNPTIQQLYPSLHHISRLWVSDLILSPTIQQQLLHHCATFKNSNLNSSLENSNPV